MRRVVVATGGRSVKEVCCLMCGRVLVLVTGCVCGGGVLVLVTGCVCGGGFGVGDGVCVGVCWCW